MAHNLNEENGIISFAANAGSGLKDKAWHGLGQYFDRPMTVKEAIEASQADYNVNKGTLLHITNDMVQMIKNGEPINHLFTENNIVNSHKCTYREDNSNILGVVGTNYEVVQNIQGFDFINEITGVGENECLIPGAFIETAGILGDGQQMFVTAKLPKTVRIGDQTDIVEDFILFSNSHDGSNAVTACFTPIRVVCNNTLNAAFKHCTNRIYFRHTKNVANKLAMAKQVMNLHDIYVDKLSNTLIDFSNKQMTDTTITELVAKVFLADKDIALMQKNNGKYRSVDEISTRSKNQIDSMISCIQNGVGQERYAGTALWVYNGFTSFYNNEKSYKTQEKKMQSLTDANGDGAKKTQKAMDLLLAM